MTDQEIIDIFLKYVDSLKEATLFSDVWMNIKWYLIYGLYQILNAIKGWQTQILTFFDFYKYAGLKTFIDQYQLIAVAIAVLVLVATILIFIYTNKHDYRGLFSNFIFGIFMMFGLSIFVSMLTPIARDVIGLSNATETSEIQVIRENLIDFRTIDQDGWQWNYDDAISDDNKNQPNELSRGIVKEYVLGNEVTTVDSKATNYLKLISPSETIDSKSSDITDDGKKILGKKLIYTYGEYSLEKGTSWWKPQALETSYYRYNFRFWRLLFYFLIKIVVSILLMWKLGKILLEMNFSILYAQIAGLTDLRTGKRNIMVLQSVFNSIIVAVLIFILQRLFDIGYIYIDSVASNFFFGLFMKAILANFIIDGPNLVEKLFGIDSGLSSMGNTLLSLNQGAQMLGGFKSAIGGGIGSVGNMTKSLTGAGASLVGAGAGANAALNELNDYFDQLDSDNDSNNLDSNVSSNDQDELNSDKMDESSGNNDNNTPIDSDLTSDKEEQFAETVDGEPNDIGVLSSDFDNDGLDNSSNELMNEPMSGEEMSDMDLSYSNLGQSTETTDSENSDLDPLSSDIENNGLDNLSNEPTSGEEMNDMDLSSSNLGQSTETIDGDNSDIGTPSSDFDKTDGKSLNDNGLKFDKQETSDSSREAHPSFKKDTDTSYQPTEGIHSNKQRPHNNLKFNDSKGMTSKLEHKGIPKQSNVILQNSSSEFRGNRNDATEAYHQGKFNTVKNTVSDTVSNKFNSIHQVKKFNAAKTVSYENVMNAYQERLEKYQNKEES